MTAFYWQELTRDWHRYLKTNHLGCVKLYGKAIFLKALHVLDKRNLIDERCTLDQASEIYPVCKASTKLPFFVKAVS